MTTKSAKHANKTFGSAKDTAAKAVDTHKVAALSAGAAGVIAGAAIAFGATPAMAAETPASAPVNTNDPAKEQSVIANKKKAEGAEASKVEASNKNSVDAKPVVEAPQQTKVEAPTDSKESADAKQSVEPTVTTAAPIASTESTEENKTGKTESTKGENAKADGKSVDDKGVKQDTAENSTPAGNVAKSRKKRDLSAENHNQGEPVVGTDREANPEPSVSNQINISEDTKNSVPNMYAWGSSNNTYIKSGQSNTVTFNFAKPKDGYNISSIAIFPAQNNSMTTDKGRKAAEYYSGNPGLHQSYSGEYTFTPNTDGSAKLEMTPLFRDGNLNSGVAYAANRCIYVYGRKDGGDEVLLYKTNIARAATLIPPKTAGSIVLKYNEELTAQQIREKLQKAIDAPTEATGNKSIREQINTASTSKGVGTRGDNGAFVQTPDTAENKVIINDQRVYNPNDVTSFNTKTPKPGTTETTYITTVRTLKTHLITDTGYTSDDLPLTVARYDDRIEKPIVDDLSKVSDDVKTEIKRKLAHLNHVSQDQVTINDQGEVTINFAGVDAADAPKIALRDLVLKKLEEKDVTVPTGDKAVFVANPLGYSNAELDRIKTAIYEANKDNQELGLSKDNYKDQITLSYITGDLTGAGDANKGRSNGLQENNISVTIKTDKAVAKFTSDIIKDKLTRLPDIRTDYNVELVKNKLDGRDSDEGFSWSDDKHTTLIYRYDSTKAQAFTAPEILKLIKATPKDQKTGLRPLTGGEALDHEGANGKARKSHVYYAINENGEPTTELTLGMMNGAYWIGNPQVANSDANLGNEQSIAGKYTWDEEAGSVTVAAKQNKVFKTRLFVAPYTLTFYRGVYTNPYQKDPNNTPKAINIIFVPQTNHKTSDLQKSIGEHATTQVEGKDIPTDSKYYNASDKVKKDYEDALKVANNLYSQVKDKKESELTEQQKADIDNATINLNKAREALDGAKTNKDGLNTSIDANGKAAEGANPASGTQATNQFKNVSEPDFKTPDGKADETKNNAAKAAKKAYDEALKAAEAARDDDNATQKAVDDAKAKLDEARAKLNDFTTNKDELNNAIAQHGKVNTGDAKKTDPTEKLKTADPTYQNSSEKERKAYDDAVKKADEVSKDPNASQKEVNEAIKKLKDAKDALDKNATDKSPLDAAVQKSFDNPDSTKPDKQSVFYKNAAAKKDTDPAAKKAVEDYDKALQKAKDVLADKNATKKDVEDAKKALEDAEAALHTEAYQTKDTDLAQALADNFSGYLMPAYFNAFDKAQAEGKDSQAAKDFKAYNDAYHAAKDLLKDIKKPNSTVTQKQAEEVKNQLIEARKLIDTYATDTSKLSAAALNNLAIQNSPAYKNLKALAEKENPSEAEKADVEAAKKAKKAYDDAAEKLHKAITNTLPKDQANGHDIPDNIIPKEDGDPNDKDYLKGIQAHKNGEPLNRDVDTILKEMNDAAAELNKFATKTDDLIKSINEDATTHPSPAFKNASQQSFQKSDGSGPDDTKNAAAKKAVDEYGEALNKAKDLLKDPNATQAQINEAKKNLDEKRAALDAYNTDTTKLAESVGKHGSTDGAAPTEGTQTSDAYRNASDPHFMKEEGGKLVPDKDKNDQAAAAKKAYDEALTKAQELLKKHDDNATPQDAKPTQKDINDALKALDDARTKLDTYKTDTTALNTEAEKSQADTEGSSATGKFEDTPEFKNAKAKTSDGDENADVTAYKTALANARKLVNDAKDTSKKNSERPTQKQINDALDALKAAKKQITDNYKTNLEPLTSAKDFAGVDFKKTPEYQNAVAKKGAGDQGATQALGEDGKDTGFDNILKKVTEKLNDDTWKQKATQKEVSALLKQLQDAQEKIAKEYKTDAIKLENEVGDKDQDGKPVTPPFEASVAYKNALEKAKAESKEDADKDTSATKKLAAYAEKLAKANELIEKVKNPDPNAKLEDRPTQKQVDDALAALKQAKKDIDDNFKTKVDKLQNEVDDKNEDGTARTPKFEESTEFANLKAKQEGDKEPEDLTAYKEALAKAKELIDKNDGKVKNNQGQEVDVPKDQLPSQKEVDEALQKLKGIKDKILANYKTSPKDLQDEVDKSKDGDEDTSTDVFENTPEFKNATAKGDDAAKQALKDYNDKLDAAKKLLDAFDRTTGEVKKQLPDGMTKAPTQKQLDDALKELQAAKKKITDGYKTDSSKLKSETDADDAFTKTPEYQNAQAKGDDASKQALEDYKKALDEANKVLGDKNATQKQVDDALKKLQDAKSKLSDGYKTNKSDLDTEAGKDSDFIKSPEYQNAAGSSEADAYKQALDEANKVLGDKNATQAEVDEALKKLQDAKQKLTDSHKTDKSDLNTEAGNDPDFRKSIPFIIGKAADLAEYQQALNDANSVLKDPNATQDQVNRALRRLRDAKQKLIDAYNRLINSGSGVGDNTGVGVNDSNTTSVNNVVDKSALQAEVDQALGDVSANANGVVADSNLVSEFNAALNHARLVLADANATQGQVDSALARLRAARAALREGMLAARNSAGMNFKRGDVSGVNTGASSSVFAALAAVFAGLGVAGAASKRRKHSAR
ncbi:FIVAR domain-containing protein [Gardnerella vaginalis]|uniref:FIVAR domain-containing protein n=1 Tax=Gardnerella vaginalis TaxID=2702 RepID=UPI0002635421|nr:FIVAR domain-containing protein [Gardnerella vaginalis]EIK75659.1 very large surface anchored protein [Gardnerella vaginalis 75712]